MKCNLIVLQSIGGKVAIQKKLFTKYGRDAYQYHYLKHFPGMLRCYSGGKKRHESEDSKKGGGKMKSVSRGVVSFIACVVLIVSFSAAVSAGN